MCKFYGFSEILSRFDVIIECRLHILMSQHAGYPLGVFGLLINGGGSRAPQEVGFLGDKSRIFGKFANKRRVIIGNPGKDGLVLAMFEKPFFLSLFSLFLPSPQQLARLLREKHGWPRLPSFQSDQLDLPRLQID